MPLTIQCTMCGANIVAEDLDVRRGMAVCSHCSTLLRITGKGTEQYRQSLQTAAAPAGVVVRRENADRLSITAPRTSAAFAINGPELGRGVRIGLLISGGMILAAILLSVPLVLIFGASVIPFLILLLVLGIIPTAIVIVFVCIIYFAVSDKSLPPVRLQNGNLLPSALGAEPIAAGNVRQIYSTATKILAGSSARNFESYFVYALLGDGRRVALIGPVDSPETALYVEEMLEVGLGILDLPVYGDANLPAGKETPAPVAAETKPALKIRCDGCSAELTVDDADTRRGYTACRYCGGLTLLYEPGSRKPILGIPSSVSADSQYLLRTDSSGTTILDRNSGVPVVKIAGGRMELSRPTGSPQSIPLDKISQLGVKAAGRAENAGSAGAAIAAGILKLGNVMAYSGEVDPAKMFRDSLMGTDFQILVKTDDGREYTLLPGIRDAAEAFSLMNSIRQAGRLG